MSDISHAPRRQTRDHGCPESLGLRYLTLVAVIAVLVGIALALVSG
ncbi:hypothetical protein [Falsirhodobacter algicola]|uniref:Uncharacterized protein n=1 Tax=Falsirhodobacter algicola TaxID=2692330 RepID=A0A8J8SLQ7_9RHOB|nr:hypothetical protein [Falsirhodobacter algicola]QUS36732.1 hypothetical protein GR316_10940 [Falsirhodobacter algicola]